MQWDETQYAGFSTAAPWLPVNENRKDVNVKKQDKDPQSVLNHFRKMTALRKSNPVLVHGAYQLLDAKNPDIYAYTREMDGKKLLVVLNFKSTKKNIALKEAAQIKETLINNYESVDTKGEIVTLEPYQAVIFALK
jgi:oligo-1,6-glucosidase